MKIFRLSGIVLLFLMLVTTVANASVTITSQGGWFESAFVEFTPDGSFYYNVYYSTSGSGPWTKIDDQLVRKYGSNKGRADVVGIKAGTYYVKVSSMSANGTEASNKVVGPLTVKAHDRGGFAHFNNANNVGAYKDDGTLKAGANVLYITKSNAKTITMTVPSAANKTTIYTGLQTIINAWTKAYSNHWSTVPLDIRVLGTLSYDDMDMFSSSAEGIQIKGASNYASCPITFEGVGNDAVIHGFGFLVRNMQNLEMRNFAIMNCLDDCVSLDSNNSHIWVHNLDLFYGNAGSDKDQVKGDGTIDLKGNSQFITISYNHFWDSGKSSLCGMKSESGPNYITYHHNWFDHSDSRHPRIRTMSVHVYNNYFDGVAKYGTGVTMGASAFVDRNYFRSCKFPMLSSLQGSDVYAGTTTRNPDSNGTFSGENSGIIKSYGNVITGNCTYIPYGASTYLLKGTANTPVGNINTTQDFDAYEVSTPTQTVPNTVKGYAGGSTYNNFDQSMYSYTADAAEDVPSIVKGEYGAGRMQHGSYQHTFTEADDSDYGVIASLKSDVQGYKSTSYYVGVTNSMYFKDGVITDSAVEGGGGGEEEEPTPTTSDDATLKSLTVSGYSLSFSSSTTYYAVTLKYGTESAPTVSATANNSNATVTITQATSPTGKATVKVTAEDGTTIKLYEVQFSVAAEPVADGSSISSAMTLNMTDDGYTSYITGTYTTSTSKGSATYGGVTGTGCIKMESKTSLSFTTTKAFTMTFVAASTETASFKLDGTTVAASSGNTVSVDVAAGTHEITKSTTINLFFLDFADATSEPEPTPTQSSDATLSALSVAGYTLTPAFSSSTLTYSVELAAGTTSVPAITATPNDTKAKAYVDTENCHPAGQAIIDVEAEDGTSGKYYINFTVASAYYNVSAAAGTGGTAVVSPSGSVAEGTSVTFTATPNSGYTFSKWSDNSTENPHTVTVTGNLALTAQFTENATPTPTPSTDVVLLEVNGTKVSEDGTFTGSDCTTNIAFANECSFSDGSGKSPLSTSTGKIYRTSDATSITLGLTSTSASQIVLCGYSNGSTERTVTGVQVNGTSVTGYTVSGTIADSSKGYRVTISGLDIAQGSNVTIETSGKTKFIYFEITPVSGSTPVQTDALALVDGEDYTLSEDKTYADGVTYTKNFASADQWNPLYVPFAVNVADYASDFDIAEIFAVCPVEDTNHDGEVTAEDDIYLIVYKKTSGSTVPNRPYLIRAKSSGSKELVAVDGKVYAATNGSVTCSTTAKQYIFTGTYSPVYANTGNDYWYLGGSGLSHRTSAGNTTIKSNRWYMSMTDNETYSSSANSQNSINILVIGEDIDAPTAINAVRQTDNNGADTMYNLNGQQVNSSAAKGIYIKNGVKVIR